jgi:hypothetical protein
MAAEFVAVVGFCESQGRDGRRSINGDVLDDALIVSASLHAQGIAAAAFFRTRTERMGMPLGRRQDRRIP